MFLSVCMYVISYGTPPPPPPPHTHTHTHTPTRIIPRAWCGNIKHSRTTSAPLGGCTQNEKKR